MSHFLILSISYVLLAVFVVWIAFGKRFSGMHKVFLSLLLPAIYFLHWQGLNETKGWPTDETLPTQFELISADIVEPNPLKKVEGNINLWVRPEEDGPPRSYSLPYSRDLHKRLFETKKRMAEGRKQVGLLSPDGGGSGASVGGGMRLGFRNAPRKHLPPKGPIK